MSKFKKGDVVEIKSGGAGMTVAEVGDFSNLTESENGVRCVWQVKGVPYDQIFDEELLRTFERAIGVGSNTVNLNRR